MITKLLTSLVFVVFFIQHGVGQGPPESLSNAVLLHFTATWCPHCRGMEGSLQGLADSGWLIRQVDIDREKSLAQRWNVREVPTIVIVRDGKEIDRLQGMHTESQLAQRLGCSVARPAVQPITTVSAKSVQPQRTDPMAASVRIRIDDGTSTSFGTGTIIDEHRGEVLVLTCGHLFRGLHPSARITVDVPVQGRYQNHEALVIDHQCQDADIGLVSFHASLPVVKAPLLPRGRALEVGEAVCSIGCDHGADPSRRDSHITMLNRYLGPSNVEVAKAPVQGRSGGGLFNRNGELIGVCYAAEQSLDEGLYSGPEVVYVQLARLGLSRLYESTPTSSLPPSQVAVAPDEFPDRTFGDAWKSAMEQAAQVARSPQPTFESHGATLVAFVRDRHGREQRIEIKNPTPTLLQTLQSQSESESPSRMASR